MKLAHLILAHRNPPQLARLLAALAQADAECIIHLDQKAHYPDFAHLAARPGVRFTRQRLAVKWGGYSLTQAALEGMREILSLPTPFDFINVLSAQDYPIKPLATMHAELAKHQGQSFVEYEAAGSAWWLANESRVSRYYLTEWRLKGRYALAKVLNRVLPARRSPLPLYGGNMGGWYTLSREAATYVVQYLDTHPTWRRFAYYSWGSDEFVVQTTLLNSPLAPTIINNNLRYIDWSAGGSSPRTLTLADLPALLASPRLFARKFAAGTDATVLDRLDLANGHPAPLTAAAPEAQPQP